MNLIKIGDTIINVDNITKVTKVKYGIVIQDDYDKKFMWRDSDDDYPQALVAYEWLTKACIYDANDTKTEAQAEADRLNEAAEDDKQWKTRHTKIINGVSKTGDWKPMPETETEALRQRIAELEARLDERNQLIADAGRELGQTSGDEHFTRAFNMLHGYTD